MTVVALAVAAQIAKTSMGTWWNTVSAVVRLNILAVSFAIFNLMVLSEVRGSLAGAGWASFVLVAGALVFIRSPLATATYVAVMLLGEMVWRGEFGAAEIAFCCLTSAIAYGLAWLQSAALVRSLGQAKDMEERARNAEAVLVSFEESGSNWLWEIDPKGDLSYISPRFAELIGHSSDDLLDSNFLQLLRNHVPASDHLSNLRTLEFYLAAQLPFREIMLPLDIEESKIWISLSGGALFDERNQFTGYSGIGTDLTVTRQNEDHARHLALFDSLTGIPNRAHFHGVLSGLLQRAQLQQSPCTLLYIDLDRFKIVNDTLGHPVGDEILKEVARRIEHVIKDRGQAGRLGGDEFVVVLPRGPNRATVNSLATRLIAELSAPYHIGRSQIVIGASIGVATAPFDGATSEELIRNADLALYAAKTGGRGSYRTYDPAMRASAEVRQALELDLRKALGEGQLRIMYQPIFDLKSDHLTGFEALLRWDHPDRGSIKPELFIGIAEESGLISVLGEWILRSALMEAGQWPDHIKIAVNLSPLQFQDAGLVRTILSAVAASQIKPERVELEITESVFLQETDVIHSTLEKLRGMGLRLVLDDFGTGYSSLGYLRKGSFSKIKIDRSFVQNIDIEKTGNSSIVRAIIALAQSLGMTTTAEGAETPEEIKALKSIGCAQVQGFAYGRPMTAGDASALIAAPAEDMQSNIFAQREGRFAMLRTIQVATARRETTAVLRNLSPNGAMFETSSSFRLGQEVELLMPNLSNPRGTIRWIQGKCRGVMFEERVSLGLIQELSDRRLSKGGRGRADDRRESAAA